MEKKYFYNAEADTLVIVDVEDGQVTSVVELDEPTTVSYEEETEEQGEEEVVEPVKVAAKKERKPQTTTYDREGVKAAINRGEKPAHIAEEFGTSMAIVYGLKSDMKKSGELHVDAKPKQIDSNDPFVSRMSLMLSQGKTEQDIYAAMHDSLTDAQFREKLEIAKSKFGLV